MYFFDCCATSVIASLIDLGFAPVVLILLQSAKFIVFSISDFTNSTVKPSFFANFLINLLVLNDSSPLFYMFIFLTATDNISGNNIDIL